MSPYPYQSPSAGGFVCPVCKYQGAPLIKQEMSLAGWVFFIALLFFCFPMAWLPFVLDGCKDTVVCCPSCGSRLA